MNTNFQTHMYTHTERDCIQHIVMWLPMCIYTCTHALEWMMCTVHTCLCMHVNEYITCHASSHSHRRCTILSYIIAYNNSEFTVSCGLVAVIEDQLQFSGVYRRASSSLIQVTILMRSTGSMKAEEGKGSWGSGSGQKSKRWCCIQTGACLTHDGT